VRARDRAARALAEQREFYETLLRESPANIVAFDAEHRYLFFNHDKEKQSDHYPSVLGKTSAESCADRGYSPEVAAIRQHYFDTALRQGTVETWEETTVEPMGPQHWLRSMRPVFNPDGSLRMMVASGVNMTARRHTEARLQQQQQLTEQLTQRLIDTIPNPVYVSDAQGELVFINAAFSELGRQLVQRRELFLQNPRLVPEMQQLRQLRQLVLSSGQEQTVNLDYLLDSGEMHYAQVVMRPLPQPNGSLHVLVVSTDVTDLKQAQRAAVAAAQAQENFLATMSHEIRTPLNGVLGMAGLLAKTPLSPEQARYLEVVQYSGRHLMSLLNDVLDMAKITSGPLEFEQQPFDICDTMEAALRPLALQAAEKGLAFDFAPMRDTCPHPWVIGDAHRLSQILINLVANALKFTERGRITVLGEQVAEAADTITMRFSVADTGIGIAAEQQAHIFERFAQAAADTSRQYGGTGLGLSISRALVLQLDGSFTLESEEGVGSTFAFSVTLPKASPPELAPGTCPNEAIVRGWRVLLVDDNSLNLELAKAVLEQNGLVVDAALNGAAALALFDQHRYEAVLMDIHMPGMNGLEATARIRQHPDPARAATPVLAMTADAFRAQHEGYRAAGMNDCITKPFSEAELLSKLVAARAGDKNC
jgi:signal transduction histidine kinase/CheY-like chemotaxis protein